MLGEDVIYFTGKILAIEINGSFAIVFSKAKISARI